METRDRTVGWFRRLTRPPGSRHVPLNRFEIAACCCFWSFFGVTMSGWALTEMGTSFNRLLGPVGMVIAFSPLPLVLTAIVLGFVGRSRRNRRLRWETTGHCAACGYDLNALPEELVCPECGRERSASA